MTCDVHYLDPSDEITELCSLPVKAWPTGEHGAAILSDNQ